MVFPLDSSLRKLKLDALKEMVIVLIMRAAELFSLLADYHLRNGI